MSHSLTNILVVSKWNCPYEVFAEWMSDASKKVDEYNAMTIASVNKQVFPYPYATYDMRLGTFKFNFRGFHQLVWFY